MDIKSSLPTATTKRKREMLHVIMWIFRKTTLCNDKSSVIRQKGKSQNGCFKKTKQAKFSKKRTFLTP